MRILVVDDDEPTRMVVRMGLVGMEVLEAADGPAALDLLAEEEVDLVLLDIMLPRMSGLEILTQVRSDERIADVPIVMLTAQRTEHSHLTAYYSGADGYVTKPFDPLALEEAILGVLERSPDERRAVRAQQQDLAGLLDHIEHSFGA